MEKKKEILIVGAGIAGTTLALELVGRGCQVSIIDFPDPNSSSRVAAGIINPVVPKGVTLTWKIQHIFPAVFQYYQQWEILFKESFVYTYDFLTLHKTTDEYQQWRKKYDHQSMEHWIEPRDCPDWMLPEQQIGATNTRWAGRIDVGKFLLLAKEYLLSAGVRWDYTQINPEDFDKKSHFSNILSNQYKYDFIVFCQGEKGKDNPLFPDLFFDPTGGDILTLKIPGLPQRQILKRGHWLVPLGNELWLAGSNFIKGDQAQMAILSDAQQLIDQIRTWIPFPVEIIQHKRGIRPTVQNRRPYLGQSPLPGFEQCYIFNGLGSKGSSLCAWLSPMMANHLLHRSPLDPEVDISRFYGISAIPE